MREGKNQHVIGLIDVNHRIRETTAKVPPRLAAENPMNTQGARKLPAPDDPSRRRSGPPAPSSAARNAKSSQKSDEGN
jgi:hypothetical protein